MSEAEDSSSTHYIVNITFNVFFCCTAIILNSITIHAIRKTSSLPKPLKTLLLRLAVSDLSVGLLAHPLYIAVLAMGLEQTNPSNTTYKYTFIATFIVATLSAYASFFGVLALAIDRFLAIYLHLRYQEFVTHKRVVAVWILIMVLSLFLSSLPLRIPLYDWLKIYTSIEIACLVFNTIFYFKIYSTVRRHRNQIQSLQVQQDEGQNREMMANFASLAKLAVGTFYVYLVFLVCYLPHICFKIAVIFSGPSTTTRLNFQYSWTMIFLNSSLNPLIYCWRMRHIRHAVITIMQNIFRC